MSIDNFKKKKEKLEYAEEFLKEIENMKNEDSFIINLQQFSIHRPNSRAIHSSSEIQSAIQSVIKNNAQKLLKQAIQLMRNDLLKTAIIAKEELNKLKQEINNLETEI